MLLALRSRTWPGSIPGEALSVDCDGRSYDIVRFRARQPQDRGRQVGLPSCFTVSSFPEFAVPVE